MSTENYHLGEDWYIAYSNRSFIQNASSFGMLEFINVGSSSPSIVEVVLAKGALHFSTVIWHILAFRMHLML